MIPKEIPAHPDMGKNAKDIVTGFKGIIIGFCQHMTGCDTICVQPKVEKGSKHVESRWFDSNRLEIVKGKALVIPVKEVTGACCDEPQL